MLNRLKRYFSDDQSTQLEEEIAAVFSEMQQLEKTSEQYLKYLDILKKLHDLRPDKARGKVSFDTMAKVAANLIGIGIIVVFEERHVMNPKALAQVMRSS